MPYILLWIGGVCLMLFAYTTYKQRFFRRLGIHGPRPTPFLGDLGNFKKEGMFQRDKWLAVQYGGMAGTYYGNSPALVIADAETIGDVCVKQFSKFYERAEVVRIPDRWRLSLNNARGTLWKFLRTVLTPTFSASKIRNMQPVLGRCLDEFAEILNEKANSQENEVDVLKLFSALTMDVICSTAFGIEINSQRNPDDIFVKHASKILGNTLYDPLIFLNLLFPDFREIIMYFGKDYTDQDAMDFLTKAVTMTIEERRNSKDSLRYSDLLKLMLDTRMGEIDPELQYEPGDKLSFEGYKNRGMTDDEIIMNSIIFLAAGYDTTSIALSWVAYCLATNPECQTRLREEIDEEIGPAGTHPNYDKLMKLEYLDMVVSETLRMYAPAARFNREAACDVTIKGFRVPKGTDITMSIHGVHYNPRYWSDPEKFNPDRFSPENRKNIIPYSYIPFGAGPKNCIGQKLALAEIKFAIVLFLQHVEVAPPSNLHGPPKTGQLLKPEKMILKLIPRTS